MQTIKLNEKIQLPLLGFGTWHLTGDKGRAAIEKALEIGYRHIDTADRYSNHTQVAAAINNSNVPREEIFITTKVWWPRLTRQEIFDDAKRFLEELDTNYIDLLLAHFPNPKVDVGETLDAFNELYEEGIVKSVGVSNFTIKHLKAALKTGFPIHNNQIEIHPLLYDEELIEFCKENDITVSAYSALAQGKAVELDYIQKIADKYKDASPAQVILNWIMSKDIIALTKSSDPAQITDSFNATTWKLDSEDIAAIDKKAGMIERLNNPSYADFN